MKKYYNKKIKLGSRNLAILRGLASKKEKRIEILIKELVNKLIKISVKGAFATNDSIILEARTKTQYDTILENALRIECYMIEILNRANKNKKFLNEKGDTYEKN